MQNLETNSFGHTHPGTDRYGQKEPGESTSATWFSTINGFSEILTPNISADGRAILELYSRPGVVQFGVIADASRFDWEALYFDINLFNNTGQRTGPWDFDLRNGNKPLVPSYWVSVDGREIGLWFFQRVSIADLQIKRFRGNMALEFQNEGVHVIEFRPYRTMNLHWESVIVERDIDNFYHQDGTPYPPQLETDGRAYIPEDYRALLSAPIPDLLVEPAERLFEWITGHESHSSEEIWMLFATYLSQKKTSVLATALAAVDRMISQKFWGNPQKDGYSHDGDMDAASALQWLALIYRTFADELGEARRKRMLKKLTHQGNRFLELALLNRDYWGGSLLQDHGWRSMFAFATATIHLLGIIPDAERWFSYIIPRLGRSLAAMPSDGVIPLSSYGDVDLYLGEISHYRDVFLKLTGEDIFLKYPFRSVVDYLTATFQEESGTTPVSGNQDRLITGGSRFFNRMAALFDDQRAAHLSRRVLQPPTKPFYNSFQERRYYFNILESLCSYQSKVQLPRTVTPHQGLSYFEDSGLAHFRNEEVTFSVRCGPWCGYNAYRKASGPCDRMGMAPGSGHFVLEVHGVPFLVEPDGGYRLHSNLRSCLLIDNAGQHGDIGYPMGIPSKPYHGEEIRRVDWEDESGLAEINLDLASAYPEELGVLRYTRDLIVGGKGRMICRDHVVLREAKPLSWLFHGSSANKITTAGALTAHLGDSPRLTIKPLLETCGLNVSTRKTDVVWSYVSTGGFKPFQHVRYDTIAPTKVALIEFLITW